MGLDFRGSMIGDIVHASSSGPSRISNHTCMFAAGCASPREAVSALSVVLSCDDGEEDDGNDDSSDADETAMWQ